MKKIFKSVIPFLLCFCPHSIECSSIHPHGYWIGNEELDGEHAYDETLSNALVKFFKGEGASSIVDFGCGKGSYIHHFLQNNLDVIGFDGNPHTFNYSKGVATTLDLSEPFDLEKRFDWVMSLEVGEHLPPRFEAVFIENLIRHSANGIVLSWAVEGQGGHGHFNEKNNNYIKAIFKEKGFINDVAAENQLRQSASLFWFKNTIMVFRKP